MTPRVLFAAEADGWETYQPSLEAAFADVGLTVDLANHFQDPASVDYIIFSPNGPISDFTPYTGAKLAQNLWAGVETIVGNATLKMPLARMVDIGMIEGMVEYVTGHALRYHLNTDLCAQAKPGDWRTELSPPLARDRTVGVMGLGALGLAVARTLAGLNFNVLGWSRSQKSIPGITCLSGEAGKQEILRRAEILVLLVPYTPETENLLNAKTIAWMPEGAALINPGRGPLIDDAALLAALDSGALSGATLDVFRTEPLPAEDPYWTHPNVLVTPHIASETRPRTASQVVAENIRRGEAGEPFLHLVDRSAGY